MGRDNGDAGQSAPIPGWFNLLVVSKRLIPGLSTVVAISFLLFGVVRISLTYRSTAPCFDEPASVAAGVEWFDRGTYTVDPIHPPLPRIAIGLPLYLEGERYPAFSPGDPRGHNYNDVGNRILYGDGHYLRNLILARCGVLPFFLLAGLLVFIWTRDEFGNPAALAATALFTTLPAILAFSSIAYTDIPAACMQFASLFAFVKWLKNPSLHNRLWLGIVFGLAVLSNFTSLLFLSAAGVAILLCKWLYRLRGSNVVTVHLRASSVFAIALIAGCVI